MKRLFSFIVTSLTASSAFATSPCMPPDEPWMIENVIKQSDMVVIGEIESYSDASSADKGWTKLKVLETIYSKKELDPELKINGWQSYYYPLYTYKEGTKLLLWLKQDGSAAKVTELTWDKCVPSVWSINPETGTIYSPIKNSLSSEYRKFTTQELKEFIQKANSN